MATLQSPGVQVQVIDESFYTPAAPGTVPMIFIATAQDKANAAGTGTAQGTTAAAVGQVWAITSQRDLVDTFGTPLFYTDSGGNSLHGSELNEYGLQAAYSLLGVSSRAYVVRADVDLEQLAPTATEPTGNPVSGTYWIDTQSSSFGVNEWNSVTQTFTVKTPIIIDNSNVTANTTALVPNTGVGRIGDYAMVVTSDNVSALWYKENASTWVPVVNGSNKRVVISPHTSYPNFTSSTPTGSVWIKTTKVAGGANWNVNYYNGSTQAWVTTSAPIYSTLNDANKAFDFAGGGVNIPAGTVFVENNIDNTDSETANFKVWRRNSTGKTSVVGIGSGTTTNGGQFTIREASSTTSTWRAAMSVTVDASTTTGHGGMIAQAITLLAGDNVGQLKHITASYDAETRALTITHLEGGNFQLRDETGILSAAGIRVTGNNPPANLYAVSGPGYLDWTATSWKPLSFVAKPTAPVTAPVNGTMWFNSSLTDVDIMIHNGTTWVGYKQYSGHTGTDPLGPIVSALEPKTQQDGVTALVTGDIWVSTATPENYGKEIYVYNSTITLGSKWVLQDVADQTTPNGWVFADARWATSGSSSTPSTIKALLSSSFLDPDAPDPALYPQGTRLWNTRRSGNNVKKFRAGYLDLTANAGINIRTNQSMSGYVADRWVSQEARNEDGSGRFGRKAQRAVVVQALKATINANQAIRDTDTVVFNLMATPGYVETVQNMISLNADRGYTAFIVGDTPFRLPANGTALSNWGSNAAAAFSDGEDGATSFDDYGCMALFYPSGYTSDNSGNDIVVPPSHMMLRTIANSDAKSYQWFAPAGLRRGGIDNATSVGYIDSATGEFKPASLHEGIRDIMQSPTVKINPIATLPGIGLVNYGQRTRYRADSALDRINVARLIAFLRRQLGILARPYLFEPNDTQTRRELKAAVDSLLLELVGQRALNDFAVVCDTSNNTRSRIDRNELWLDLAIEPVKAIEYIYIPLRLKKTGAISAGV